MDSTLEILLETYAEGVLSGLQDAFHKPILNFRRDLYPSLARLDLQIPGIGMHYAV